MTPTKNQIKKNITAAAPGNNSEAAVTILEHIRIEAGFTAQDVAESFGLAADVCSRCSAETGVAINDDFPRVGKAVLTTNMPCNASEATSMFQRRRFGMPDFPVTLAMIHNEPGAHPYSTQMLKDAIAFIEAQYGVTYDWNALFARAEHMNEQNRIELEKWELFKTPYSALCGIAESLYRLYAWASVNGQEDQFTKNDRKVLKLMLDAYQRRYQPFGGTTRHRAFLWGPSAVYYTDFPTWVQNCWGINIVLNMDSTMGHNMISTTDPEQAIQDLALFSEKGVMRHHAVGGWDNVNAVWEWASKFNCDMVIFNDNVACKGMNGVHALMEASPVTASISTLETADTSGCSAALQDRKAPARLPMAITAASPAATHWMIRFCIVLAPFPKSFGSHRTKPSDGLCATLPLVRAYARCHRIRTES